MKKKSICVLGLLLMCFMFFGKTKQINADSVAMWETKKYTLEASATGRMNVRFSHDYNSSGSWFADLYKVNADGTRSKCFVGKEIPASGGTYSFPGIGCVKGDKFEFEIYCGSGAQGLNFQIAYNMSVYESQDYESESNNSLIAADTLTVERVMYGNCWDYDINDESDYYMIKAPVSGNMILNFRHANKSNGLGWYITVLSKNSDGSYKTILNQYNAKPNKESENITIKNIKKGTEYFIEIKWPYSGNFSAHENLGTEYSVKASFKCSTPGKPSATISSKRKVKFAWKKSSGVTGYQIQISKKSNFQKLVVNKKVTKITYTKQLSRKTKYYIRVRSYKKVGSKYYYSNWTTKRSFKTK